MDNSDLESETIPGALRDGLSEGQDFYLVESYDYNELRKLFSCRLEFKRSVKFASFVKGRMRRRKKELILIFVCAGDSDQ